MEPDNSAFVQSSEQTSEWQAIEVTPEQEARWRAYWEDQNKRLVKVRSKDREFHGLQREFLYAQADMSLQYEKSKDIKHPRDVGNARESILGRFLTDSGYLPKRYSVSNTSVRVSSTAGFISREIDILFFDADESIVLMQREDAYQVYPAESCYGAIQVKSKLTKAELKKAFENISSYKKLRKTGTKQVRHERGFGVIFAYDTDIEWMSLAKDIKDFAEEYPRAELPNAIVILSKGYFLFGDSVSTKFRNAEAETIQELQVYGYPDRQGDCLYAMYVILLSLLRDAEAPAVPIERYFHLPTTAGDYSYEFANGLISELGSCRKHGDFLRKIDEAALSHVFAYCQKTKPVTYYEVLHGAYGNAWVGKPENNSRLVFVYNPEDRPLPEVMLAGSAMAFDEIRSAGTSILVPFFYSEKEGIVRGCSMCAKETAKLLAASTNQDAAE